MILIRLYMPQLLDFNPTIIAAVAVLQKSLSEDELNVDAVRNVFLRMCINYNKKFRQDYGNIIVCCDSKDNWRKDVFPFYKASRKKNRAESPLRWDLVFQSIDELKLEIEKDLPYKIVSVERTEADDVIGVLAKMFATDEDTWINQGLIQEPEKVMIISVDKDFRQLQRYPNVSQYSPQLKKLIVERKPEDYLLEHIIRGDSGDGVPNIFSDDDVLIVEGKRQKPIAEKKLQIWITQKPEEFCDDVSIVKYYRNKHLVDLNMIPEELQKNIVTKYKEQIDVGNSKIFNYLLSKNMKNIMGDASFI